MKNQIKKAESYCKTLKGQSIETKTNKVYQKFSSILTFDTCQIIAKRF